MPDVAESIRCPYARLAQARSLNEAVVCLDVDECSYLGGDSNDILRVLQHCARAVIDGQRDRGEQQSIQELRSSPDFRALLRMLVNPKMVEAVKAMTLALGYPPAIVLYTAKADLVFKSGEYLYEEYFTAWERFPVPEEGKQAQIRTEILIPGDDVVAGPDYLSKQLVAMTDFVVHGPSLAGEIFSAETQLPWAQSIYFQRAGFMFWAIAEELGLKYIPHAVVTSAGDKDLRTLSTILAVPFEKLVLFDDKSERHASRIKPEPLPLDDARMVQIQPYTFQTMDQKRRAELQALVRKVMPDEHLREGLAARPDIFRDASAMGQNGWPRENLVLTADYTWRLGQEADGQEAEGGELLNMKKKAWAAQEDWPLPAPDYLDADRHTRAERLAILAASSSPISG